MSSSSTQAIDQLPPLPTRWRLFQALIFEIVAALLCGPVIAWSVDAGAARSLSLMLIVSVTAMTWNVVFNHLYDLARQRLGLRRSGWARVLHAALFEAGLMAATVPLAAWWLQVGWWQAVLLDLGVLMFFLPYTMVFNAVADRVRLHWRSRRAAGGNTGQACEVSPKP